MARKWAFAQTFITFLSVLVSRSQVSKQANQERLAREQRTEEAKAALNPPVPRPATSCGAQLNLGFHIQSFSGGLRAAVWYPATQAESSYEYPAAWLSTAVARDAPVADCQVYPLVVYSHGL